MSLQSKYEQILGHNRESDSDILRTLSGSVVISMCLVIFQICDSETLWI